MRQQKKFGLEIEFPAEPKHVQKRFLLNHFCVRMTQSKIRAGHWQLNPNGNPLPDLKCYSY